MDAIYGLVNCTDQPACNTLCQRCFSDSDLSPLLVPADLYLSIGSDLRDSHLSKRWEHCDLCHTIGSPGTSFCRLSISSTDDTKLCPYQCLWYWSGLQCGSFETAWVYYLSISLNIGLRFDNYFIGFC